MKRFFLLLATITYIPVPRKFMAPAEQFPKAIRLLPLIGAISGGLLYLASRITSVMPPSGAAAVMLGITLLCGGAHMLRDLMVVANGLSVDPRYYPEMDRHTKKKSRKKPVTNPDNENELTVKAWRYNTGRTGLMWGGVWISALFLVYLLILVSESISSFAFVLAPVICFWLQSWLIYYFYAVPPAWLHRNYPRKDFVISSLIALAAILPFSCMALYMAIVISFLGVHIFGTYRQRTVGGLEDVCYGTGGAWGLILFLLTWVIFDKFA